MSKDRLAHTEPESFGGYISGLYSSTVKPGITYQVSIDRRLNWAAQYSDGTRDVNFMTSQPAPAQMYPGLKYMSGYLYSEQKMFIVYSDGRFEER